VPHRSAASFDGGAPASAALTQRAALRLATVHGTLSAATLEAPPSPLAWVRWAYRWTPASTGQRTIRARATDGNGATETPVQRQPYPDGATGYHVLQVNVVRG
jgi:hypothetical protein